jgi:hypothetical protein
VPNWNSIDEKGKQDYISMRVGPDFAHWQGVQDDPDPSTLQPGALAVGENIRLRARGKFISERPGVTELNSTAMNSGAAVVGIYDERVWAGTPGDGLPAGRGVRMVMSARVMFNDASTEGSNVYVSATATQHGVGALDETLSSTAQVNLFGSASQVYGPLFVDEDGTVYVALLELSSGSYVPYLCSFKPTPVKVRTDALVSLQPAPAKLCRIPMAALGTGAYPVITSITRVGPYIYIGVTGWSNTQSGETGWNGLTSYPPYDTDAKVYRWDGKTLTLEKTVTPIDSSARCIRTLLYPYGEILVASFFQERAQNEATAATWWSRTRRSPPSAPPTGTPSRTRCAPRSSWTPFTSGPGQEKRRRGRSTPGSASTTAPP